MNDEPQTYRTKTGRVLTDADVEALADEAERGYEVDRLTVSNRIRARPVWKRHLLRTTRNVEPMPLPTWAECYDAIRVLEDLNNEVVPGLWDEAQRIFMEASVPSRKEALAELTRLAEEMPGGYR